MKHFPFFHSLERKQVQKKCKQNRADCRKKGALDIFHFLPPGLMTQPVVFLNRMCLCGQQELEGRSASLRAQHALWGFNVGKAVDSLHDVADGVLVPFIIHHLSRLLRAWHLTDKISTVTEAARSICPYVHTNCIHAYLSWHKTEALSCCICPCFSIWREKSLGFELIDSCRWSLLVLSCVSVLSLAINFY